MFFVKVRVTVKFFRRINPMPGILHIAHSFMQRMDGLFLKSGQMGSDHALFKSLYFKKFTLDWSPNLPN